jgi:hypothetical protein
MAVLLFHRPLQSRAGYKLAVLSAWKFPDARWIGW